MLLPQEENIPSNLSHSTMKWTSRVERFLDLDTLTCTEWSLVRKPSVREPVWVGGRSRGHKIEYDIDPAFR